jgi:YD repeat-containing protein
MHVSKRIWRCTACLCIFAGVASAQTAQTEKAAGAQTVTPTAPLVHDATRTQTRSQASAGVNGTVSVNYAYDSLSRLIQENYPAQSSGYSYDAAGNRTQAQTQ